MDWPDGRIFDADGGMRSRDDDGKHQRGQVGEGT